MAALSRLLRPRLSLLNGVAALAGYLLFPAEPAMASMSAALIGVALLAAGGSAFNQVQERNLDRLMLRTRDRPIPSGNLTPAAATAVGGGCTLAGFILLGSAGGLLPILLGVAGLAWYLGVYTPLKKRTTFALPIGALCGTFPPVIGWTIAGGAYNDYRIILLSGLLYMWQVPHFWLFQNRHADDYRLAGIPLLSIHPKGIFPVGYCRLWLYALIAGAMLLPAFGIIERHFALSYAAFLIPLSIMSGMRPRPALFSYLNLFPVLLSLILLLQK
jgi:protoheme IX farnesyltransferase